MSLAGREVASFAVGSAGPSLGDAPMRTDMLLPWWSSTKPLTAIAIGQQIDAGRMRLSDPVAKFVPEFAQNGKGGVTLEHVLLHTAGFPKAGLDAPPVDGQNVPLLLRPFVTGSAKVTAAGASAQPTAPPPARAQRRPRTARYPASARAAGLSAPTCRRALRK